MQINDIIPQNIYDKNKCIELIYMYLLSTKRPGLWPVITRSWYIKKYNLIPLYQSIKWLTQNIQDISIIERIYRVYNNIEIYNYCKQCKINRTTFDKFTTGYRNFCSIKCSTQYNTPSKFWSNETKLSQSNKISNSRKNIIMTEDWKNKLKIAANLDDVKHKKQETCLVKYGITNPGVLGAFSSKSALNYILQLLGERNINFERTMFKYNNKQEFWQMIFVPFMNKMRYFSYDLMVFSTIDAAIQKDLTKIDLVFEYNGPWHYQESNILGVENTPATPYKSNKFTKAQQVELDKLKLNHIAKFSPKEILIYWEKCNLLESVTIDNILKVI